MPRLAATASCDVTEMRQSEHAISYGDAHVAEARSPRGPAGVQLALDCRAYQDWHNVIDWLSNPRIYGSRLLDTLRPAGSDETAESQRGAPSPTTYPAPGKQSKMNHHVKPMLPV